MTALIAAQGGRTSKGERNRRMPATQHSSAGLRSRQQTSACSALSKAAPSREDVLEYYTFQIAYLPHGEIEVSTATFVSDAQNGQLSRETAIARVSSIQAALAFIESAIYGFDGS